MVGSYVNNTAEIQCNLRDIPKFSTDEGGEGKKMCTKGKIVS